MFLFSILLKHPSPINSVMHINLDTSDVPIQHLCIATPKYEGLYKTFYEYVILSFCRFFFRHTSAKMKNDQQVVVETFGSYQNFMINYESVSARPPFD